MDLILKKNIKKRISEYYKDKISQDELMTLVESYFATIHDKTEMIAMVNEIVRLTEKK